MYCDKCGNQLQNGDSFCRKCGRPIPSVSSRQSVRFRNPQTTIPTTNKSRKPQISIALVIVVLFICYKIFMAVAPIVNTSYVIDTACTEIKREVYNSYGEIPHVQGEILYQNRPYYIVKVTYILDDTRIKGSYACRILAYRKSNSTCMSYTYEMPYTYDYNIEELKTMWGID